MPDSLPPACPSFSANRTGDGFTPSPHRRPQTKLMPDLDCHPDAGRPSTRWRDTLVRINWYEGRRSLVQETLRRFEKPGMGSCSMWAAVPATNMEMLADVAHNPVVGLRPQRALSPRCEVRAEKPHHHRFGRRPSGALARCEPVAGMDVVRHLDDDVAGLLRSTAGCSRRTGCCCSRCLRTNGCGASTMCGLRTDAVTASAACTRFAEAAGFEVLHTTYSNSFLVPPAAVLRRTPQRRLVKDFGRRSGQHRKSGCLER